MNAIAQASKYDSWAANRAAFYANVLSVKAGIQASLRTEFRRLSPLVSFIFFSFVTQIQPNVAIWWLAPYIPNFSRIAT